MAHYRDKSPQRFIKPMAHSPQSGQSFTSKGNRIAEIMKAPCQLSPGLSPRRPHKENLEYTDEYDPANPGLKEKDSKSPLGLLSPVGGPSSESSHTKSISPSHSSSNKQSFNISKKSNVRGKYSGRYSPRSLESTPRGMHFVPRILLALAILMFAGVVTFYEQFCIEGTYDPYPEMQGFQRKTVGNVKSREHAINSLLDDFEPDLYSEYMDQTINDDLNQNPVTLCNANRKEIDHIAGRTNKSFISVDHSRAVTFRESITAFQASLWLAQLADLVVVVPPQLLKKPSRKSRKLMESDESGSKARRHWKKFDSERSEGKLYSGAIPKLHDFDADGYIEEMACRFETLIATKAPKSCKVHTTELFSEENEWDLEHFSTIVEAEQRKGGRHLFKLSHIQLENVLNFHLNRPEVQKLLAGTKLSSRQTQRFNLEEEAPFFDYEAQTNRKGMKSSSENLVDVDDAPVDASYKKKRKVTTPRKRSDAERTTLGRRSVSKLPEYLSVDGVLDEGVEEDFVYLNEEDDSWANPVLIDSLKNPQSNVAVLSATRVSGRTLKSILRELSANDV